MRSLTFWGVKRPGAASLRHHLTIEAPQDTPDAAGGMTRVWTPLGQVWAQILPLQSLADEIAERAAERLTHRIIIRWRPDLDAGMRFRLGTRIFMLHAIGDIDEKRHALACLVEEIR